MPPRWAGEPRALGDAGAPVSDPITDLTRWLNLIPALVHEIAHESPDLSTIPQRYGHAAAAVANLIRTSPDVMRVVVRDVPLRCESCQSTEALRIVSARTAYNWDAQSDIAPNHPHLLCPVCEQDYTAHWDAMWADYYAGIM